MKKYPLYEVEYYKRFRDFIEDIAVKYKDKPAISWYDRKQNENTVSYRQFRDDVRYLQESLIDLGLSGKHIAIVGENCYEWIITYIAANYCGSVAVCIDVEQSEETILQMLTMADADAVFTSASCKEVSLSYAKDARKVFLFNGKDDDILTVKQLIGSGKNIWDSGKQDTETDKKVTPDNTASIVFTSGTTSLSKPVMLSQNAILTNASDALANVSIGDIAFTNLPFYHTYGWTCSVLSMLIPGSHLYINGNMKTLLRDLKNSNAHTMLTVPLMLETVHNKIWITAEERGRAKALKKLLAFRKFLYSLGIRKPSKTLSELRKNALGSIELIICGGAHMRAEIMEEFRYMGITVLQGYGITECAPLVSVNRNKANNLDSVGFVTANCEVKIEDGEILVRGKNLMQGYYKSEKMTNESMKDGWFCTGDLGEYDKDGFLCLTGRKKNLIVLKNGKKVSPEKLEEKIKSIQLVGDVLVYGASKGVSSDDVQIAASIYPNYEKAEGMSSYEILEHLQNEINVINNSLPMYQQIQMINIREQEFSKTALQKIKRHLV